MNDAPKVTVLTSLYKCQKYLPSFLKYLSEIKDTSNIEFLLLHNAPSEEEIKTIEHCLPELPSVKHIIVPELESLYKTWNRGVDLARGEYVCVWNVDDIRLPESISEQAATLDKNPKALLTYGDFYYMYKYGEFSNELVVNPVFENNRQTFLQAHHIGCFPMWRKTLHEEYGYFDEQFRLVSDKDFQIRLSLYGELIKTESLLGAYLEDDPGKLSMNSDLQNVENAVLIKRYGIYQDLNWLYAFRSISRYKLDKVEFRGSYIPLRLPPYFRTKRLPLLLLSIFKQPRLILSYIKHKVLKK